MQQGSCCGDVLASSHNLPGIGGKPAVIIAEVEPAVDEDMAPSDMTIVYKVSSFLHLHSDFWYNSLGSTCTFRYLNVGTNISQRASSSKLNFQFIGSSTVLH